MSVQNKNRAFNRSMQRQRDLINFASYSLSSPASNTHTPTQAHRSDWRAKIIICCLGSSQANWGGEERTRDMTIASHMITNTIDSLF